MDSDVKYKRVRTRLEGLLMSLESDSSNRSIISPSAAAIHGVQRQCLECFVFCVLFC
jgi:hypothetical protein